MRVDQKTLIKTLKDLSEGNAEYAVFNKRIARTEKDVMGVRLPDMRKLAKELSKGMDADDIFKCLKDIDKNSFEQLMVAGLLICYAKISEEDKISLTREYLKYADSWALIDSFTDKMKKFDEKLWWDFAAECLVSDEEFTVRYGVMRLMTSFLEQEHLKDVFVALRKVKHDGYYVKMGMAWLYATAAITDFDGTIGEISRRDADPWTRKKALQKMLESYRITDGQKAYIRKIRDAK